jgi:hypothetical protein
MRESFKREDWTMVVGDYERLQDEFKGQKALRLEATCLVARAMGAQNDRSAARALLKPFVSAEYAKPAHYEFLIRGLLDLKQYKEAALLCRKAHSLREAKPSDAKALSRSVFQHRQLPA